MLHNVGKLIRVESNCLFIYWGKEGTKFQNIKKLVTYMAVKDYSKGVTQLWGGCENVTVEFWREQFGTQKIESLVLESSVSVLSNGKDIHPLRRQCYQSCVCNDFHYRLNRIDEWMGKTLIVVSISPFLHPMLMAPETVKHKIKAILSVL